MLKQTRIRSNALRASARGQDCTLRLPGVCNGNPETTVLAHGPFGGKGMGLKGDDTWAAFACSACHDVADGRARSDLSSGVITQAWLRGIHETQSHWHAIGLVRVKS